MPRCKDSFASVNFVLSREIKNIDQLDGLVKSARNAGLTGINTYFNPLKKIYETMKFYELSSLKQIDEELLSEILASTTGGLSDASKKNYRISVINFFAFLDKQNEEDGKAHVFDINLKNWGGVSGNKYRIVMIKRHLIEAHLNAIAINYINKEGYLFINKKGMRLTQAYVSRIVEQILFKAGIRKEKNGAHMLRHTFATMLYKKQKDLVLVQEALGHASLNTSRIYTHFDSDKLKLAAKVAEDLANE